jgi:hypothetical protein
MPLTTQKLTVATVKAEIEELKATFSEKKRHLNALLRVLEDEANGQQPLLPGTKE